MLERAVRETTNDNERLNALNMADKALAKEGKTFTEVFEEATGGKPVGEPNWMALANKWHGLVELRDVEIDQLKAEVARYRGERDSARREAAEFRRESEKDQRRKNAEIAKLRNANEELRGRDNSAEVEKLRRELAAKDQEIAALRPLAELARKAIALFDVAAASPEPAQAAQKPQEAPHAAPKTKRARKAATKLQAVPTATHGAKGKWTHAHREEIEALAKAGKSNREIADEFNARFERGKFPFRVNGANDIKGQRAHIRTRDLALEIYDGGLTDPEVIAQTVRSRTSKTQQGANATHIGEILRRYRMAA